MTIWYNVGTATATNGSTAVTGALTAWLANVKAGDEFYFVDDDRGYEVASVESNTEITLASTYQGTTGSGKAYSTKPIGPGWNIVSELAFAVADLVSAADNVITNGVGVPSDTEGNDGDTYIRTDTPSIYAKESGAWVLKASLSGPTGATGPSYQATSTTSLTIGTGSKSFTTQASRGYTVGQRLRASSSASTSNYMEGVVTSYSSTTLVLNVDRTGGSGTIASWNINITGDAGPANSLAIGSVTASTAGSNAEATITGTAPSQTLNLVLPRGNTGPANVLSIGTVESGESAAASITGDAPTQTLNLTLPQGDAATIEVGDVTTVGPEDPATVTNSGTSSEAVFDFEIPQGEPGISITPRGEYGDSTEYSFNDAVLDNGSTWVYINDTPSTGNAPPTLPTTSNDYWQLSAQRGVDGTGAVNTVNSQSPDITGDVVLSASDIEVAHSASEYTPGGSSINDHLAAIDTRFGESSAGAAPDETIASASTVDLGSTTDLYIEITGTTTITSFGTTPNIWRMVRFAGALTLTHNGTSLILPGAANITTAASDTAIFVSDGSGNWRCVGYQRSNGRHLNISSYISGLLDDADAAGARTTLGAVSGPASSTDSYVPRWSGSGGNALAGGFQVTPFMESALAADGLPNFLGATLRFTMSAVADDAVAFLNLSDIGGGSIMFGCHCLWWTSSGGFAGSFNARIGGASNLAMQMIAQSSNNSGATYSTGSPPSGTSGNDGTINLYSGNDDRLYWVNRSGVVRTIYAIMFRA